MKILITGAAGFIGGHLYNELKDKHEVVGIDNFFHASYNPIVSEVKYADIRYYQDIEPFVEWADVVFHLAAQIHVDRSIKSPQETIDINVTGTMNILEAVRKFNKKMVFASSSEVYGTAQTDAISETHQLDSQSPYAASKVAGDRLCKSYYDTYKTNVAILRNFNTFGPYQADRSYGGAIAIFTRKALLGESITVYGDGRQERDYMSVRDAIRGYMFCLEQELWGRPINVGTGETITIRELAETIRDIAGSNSKIEHVEPRPGEVMKLKADMSLANSYGFKTITDFETNLRDYIYWYADKILPTIR